MTIQTDRLILREMTEDDFDSLYAVLHIEQQWLMDVFSRLSDVRPWKTPGNCVFHYSDFWKDRYIEKLLNPDAECFVVDNEFPDADVTS